MHVKKKSSKKTLTILMALVLVCAVSVMGTLAYLSAQTNAVTNTFVAAGGGKIIDPTNPEPAPNTDETITKGFYLLESAVSYADGNYSFDTGAKLVTGNTYDKAVPGMVIPKDPRLTVNLTDGIDAYIFVKVTDSTASNLEYTMDNNWTLLTGKTDIYVYNNGTIQTGTSEVELNGVPLLASNQVTVTNENELKDVDTSTEGMQLGELNFQAYVCQAGGFENAAAAWTACFGTNP